MIPFVDLKSQLKEIEPEIRARIDAVLNHGQFILGPEVRELEAKLAAFVGCKHAITCSSGTDALIMALMAKGLRPGDQVYTTPFTFIATAEAIAFLGATPVFIDVDPGTFNMDPAMLARAIEVDTSGRACGVLAVDIFGLCSDYDAIQEVARAHDLWVIEDAAQSFGATYKGRRAGGLAELGCTSFFPAKPLGCYGDGGAVFTDSDSLADRLLSIRVHGQGQDRYEHIRLGMTGRLDSIQAAILLPKLGILDRELIRRKEVAEQYTASLNRQAPSLTAPRIPSGYRSAWAQYCLLAQTPTQRQAIRDRLQTAGIPTAVYYPIPLHLQRVFANLGYRAGDLPVSEDLASRIFALPMHPYLGSETIDQIVTEIAGAAQ